MSAAVATATLEAQDAEARALAQTVFDRPLIIEAGAGTGKTQTLVSRIVAWSVGPGWERAEAEDREATGSSSATRSVERSDDRIATRVLRGVVAITFTEAAAAEMASRLAEVLAAIERGERPVGLLDATLERAGASLRTRARVLLGALDHVVIRTIHAYCRRLLGRYPLEAAVHPNLRVDADGTLQSEVVREVMEAAMRRGYSDPNDDLLLDLAEHGIGPLQIEEALNALVADGIPPATLTADPFTDERIDSAVAELRACLDDLRSASAAQLRTFAPTSVPGQVDTALTATLASLHGSRIATVAQLEQCSSRLKATWPKPLLERLRAWGYGELRQKERGAFGDDAVAIGAAAARLGPLLSHWQRLRPALLDLARRALRPLLAEVYQQLRVRGIATYTALLHDVGSMLERHPDTAAAIRRDIDQLLVDELQDTDAVQCAMVRTLALSGPLSERPALFLVGDPKQSIYGWRSADLRAYDDFVDAVLAQGGMRRVLSVNYRSLPTILAEVSRAIEPTMQRAAGLQPAFQPLIPSPQRIVEGEASMQPSVEYWVSWPWDRQAQRAIRNAKTADVAALEAGALATDLRRVHDQDGVPWHEIGVLFRSGGDLDAYLGALREADVPYLVEGDRQYYERREVIDAAAVLRTILQPNDQLALLTALRSPMIGVPDAALLPLWSRGFPDAVSALVDAAPTPLAAVADLIRAAASDLPADVDGLERVYGWDDSLIRATGAIAALRASFATEPVDVFVERLRTTVLLEATEAARRLGAYRLANLQRFFRQLLAALEAGETDPQQLLRRIRTAIAQRVDAEEERPSDGADDAIRVLTIHRAKGLDFTHVYVMQLHKEPGGASTNPVDVSAQQEHGEYRLFSGRTLRFGIVEARRMAVAAAEQVRTLYVAMTRAKSRLVLSGKWPSDRQPVAPERARSQIRLLLSRNPAPPDLDTLMIRCAREQRWSVDGDDVRWVFPALVPARGGHTLHASAWKLDVATMQAAADRLDQLTTGASRHSSRPFVSAVSAAAVDLLDDEGVHPTSTARGTARDGRIARAAGIAVHATLETWEPSIDPRDALRRHTRRLQTLLRNQVTGAELRDALQAAELLLQRFDASACGATFRAIADHIIARELPVLIPPANSDDGPTGCYTGAIDLLYRDPATATLVVADYKTDHVATDDDIAQHIAAYRAQGTHYVRAVHQALQLSAPPRFELWFVYPGRIEVVIPA